MGKGKLYIVATPIGNLGDITKRAKEILTGVDFIACEDTRVAGGLLHHLGIKKELISLHQHSDQNKIDFIIRLLEQGKDIAYISDSGTPGISDPGQKLVESVKLKVESAKIIPIPGPSAMAAAVSVSGLVGKEFYFAGFLPKKKGRQTKLKELAELKVPIIIYESAPRLERTLSDLKKYFGDNTEVFLAREMTKKFEEYWGGNIGEVVDSLGSHKIKGEFVVVVSNWSRI